MGRDDVPASVYNSTLLEKPALALTSHIGFLFKSVFLKKKRIKTDIAAVEKLSAMATKMATYNALSIYYSSPTLAGALLS